METDWGIIAVMWWWTREDVSREDVSVSRAGLRRASTKQASSKQCAPSPKAFRLGACREGLSSSIPPLQIRQHRAYLEEISRGTGAWDKLLKNRFCTGNVFKAGCLEVFLLQTSATKRRNDASSSEQCKLVRAGFLVAVSKVWGSRVGLLGRIIWR